MKNEKKIEYLQEDQYYNTTDMGLSALLLTLGFKLIVIDKTNPKRATFIFPESKELQEAISHYWTSNERKYFDNIRLLKNRLYSA